MESEHKNIIQVNFPKINAIYNVSEDLKKSSLLRKAYDFPRELWYSLWDRIDEREFYANKRD